MTSQGEGGTKIADLIFGAHHTCPSAHDEGVVRGDDGDDIDALGLELLVLLKVRREMVDVACRLETTGVKGIDQEGGPE